MERAGEGAGRGPEAQLDLLNAELAQPRPNPGDPEAVARAEDLKEQVDTLSAELSRPKPPPDPLAGVTATHTRDQVAGLGDLFGIYSPLAPFEYGEVDNVQAAVNRQADVVGYFQAWTEDFRPDAVKQVWKRGQIPLLSWEPHAQVGEIEQDAAEYSLPTIIDGTQTSTSAATPATSPPPACRSCSASPTR